MFAPIVITDYEQRWVDIPPVLTHKQLTQRDRDLYAKAMEEHNMQEAERLRRQMAERERIRLANQRAAEEQHRLACERQAQRNVAQTCAKELLLLHLTPQQQETYKKNDWFVVEGGRTKTKYRIRCDTLMANIDVLGNNDNVQHRLCAHPRLEACPMSDHLLAQKMMLENAEDDFLRVANRH